MLPYRFKVAITGPSGVGKTSIARRLIADTFDEDTSPTVGAATIAHTIQVGDQTVTLSIWDTAGQEKFRSLSPMFFRGANAVIFVVALDAIPRDFEAAFKEFTTGLEETTEVFVCGNKSDIANPATVSALQTMADRITSEPLVFITSAKNGEGVQYMFETISERLLESLTQCSGNDVSERQGVVTLAAGAGGVMAPQYGCCG